jgi:hypothetical protein
MLIKITKVAFAAALVLGAASAALAGDNSGEYSGGFVMQGSMDGVNPAHHPDLFQNSTNGHEAYDLAPAKKLTPSQNGRKAYGFVPAAKQKTPALQGYIIERDRGEDYGPEANK